MRIGTQVETKRGDSGYVIDYHFSDPVVFFPSTGRFARVAKSDLYQKSDIDLSLSPSHLKRRERKFANAFKMPLCYAVLIGFQPLTRGYYEFRSKVAGKKYPWDNGSVWKVADGRDGNKYLVREAETGNDPENPHQIDTDGTPSKCPTSEVPIFDGGPISGKTYANLPQESLCKAAGVAIEEDWMGNITLFKAGRDIAFLQGEDAAEFRREASSKNTVEGMKHLVSVYELTTQS